MNRKARPQKHGRPAMSPLLRALTYTQAALEPVVEGMLLQSYTALDAFRRGHGSRDLFSTLGRACLIAEELSRLGYEADALSLIEAAHAALMRVNTFEHETGEWRLGNDDYSALATALAVFDTQLSAASLADIAKAEARMLEGLLRSERKIKNVAELV
jgi:hypothetical protein